VLADEAMDSLANGPSQIEELFQHVQAFDTNRDRYIDEAEMKRYLVAVGAWESEAVYTDTKWPKAWPGICKMMQADSTKGLPLTSFEMFHEKYRAGKLQSDLEQLEAMPARNVDEPAPEAPVSVSHSSLRAAARFQLHCTAMPGGAFVTLVLLETEHMPVLPGDEPCLRVEFGPNSGVLQRGEQMYFEVPQVVLAAQSSGVLRCSFAGRAAHHAGLRLGAFNINLDKVHLSCSQLRVHSEDRWLSLLPPRATLHLWARAVATVPATLQVPN
jgi:hypothetical protein